MYIIFDGDGFDSRERESVGVRSLVINSTTLVASLTPPRLKRLGPFNMSSLGRRAGYKSDLFLYYNFIVISSYAFIINYFCLHLYIYVK